MLFWLSTALNGSGTILGAVEINANQPAGYLIRETKYIPLAVSTKTFKLIEKLGYASKITFAGGVVIGVVQFSVNPTVEQGAKAATDPAFSCQVVKR